MLVKKVGWPVRRSHVAERGAGSVCIAAFANSIDRGKSSQKAVTAVARELVGFVWAIAREESCSVTVWEGTSDPGFLPGPTSFPLLC